MLSLGTDDRISVGQTKVIAIDIGDYLLAPDGTSITVSGTPATNQSVNCTVTYVGVTSNVMTVNVVVPSTVASGAIGFVRVVITFSNGEVLPIQVDLKIR